MQTYLQHQDIDGHLLRLYIFHVVISTSSERHGTAICGAARTRKDNDHQQYFRFFVFFVFCFLFTVVCEQGLK